MHVARVAALLLLVSSYIATTAHPATAQPTIAPAYAASYSLLDLGAPQGVTGNFGGLTLLAGDPNTLLIGGNANNPNGKIFSIGVVRDADNHIVGFDGTASVYANAPEIDGGLAYGPGGVLFYTGYSENLLGQIKPGSTGPDKIVSLGPLGVDRSVGSLNFVPSGYPDTGGLRLVSYNTGSFYAATLTADGNGTYNVGDVLQIADLPNGPEGFVYVPPGSDLFPGPALLVSEYNLPGHAVAYDLDADGIPLVGTRRDFVVGLTGAEGGFVDPITGDFLFSTFGQDQRVVVVGGFAAPVPEPSMRTLVLLGLFSVATIAHLRRRCERKYRGPAEPAADANSPNASGSGHPGGSHGISMKDHARWSLAREEAPSFAAKTAAWDLPLSRRAQSGARRGRNPARHAFRIERALAGRAIN